MNTCRYHLESPPTEEQLLKQNLNIPNDRVFYIDCEYCNREKSIRIQLEQFHISNSNSSNSNIQNIHTNNNNNNNISNQINTLSLNNNNNNNNNIVNNNDNYRNVNNDFSVNLNISQQEQQQQSQSQQHSQQVFPTNENDIYVVSDKLHMMDMDDQVSPYDGYMPYIC